MTSRERMMSKKKSFVTIFPEVEDVHLIKDVGMIPWAVAKYKGMDGKILVPRHSDFPRALEVPGLKLERTYGLFRKQRWNCYLWLIRNARKADVLHFFHQVKHTRISIALYKRLNPKGLVYVHLDCDGTEYGQYELVLEGTSFKRKIKRFVYQHIFYPQKFQKDILWGVQNRQAADHIVGKFPYQNVRYVPDGIRMTQKQEVSYWEKQNILLTVGRIGTAQKRTDVLLEAFAKAADDLNGWQLRIVGPIEESFKEYIENYFLSYPELKDRVVFVGEVRRKEDLYREYKQAKIFCLPSDWESFGIVNVEAMAVGCTVITTEYAAARDIVSEGKYGRLISFGDVNGLAETMKDLCGNEAYLEQNCRDVQQYASEHFSYEQIADTIVSWMEAHQSQSDRK